MKVAATFTHIRVAAQKSKGKQRSAGSNESAGNAGTIEGVMGDAGGSDDI
jgi:hypothetical protein